MGDLKFPMKNPFQERNGNHHYPPSIARVLEIPVISNEGFAFPASISLKVPCALPTKRSLFVRVFGLTYLPYFYTLNLAISKRYN